VVGSVYVYIRASSDNYGRQGSKAIRVPAHMFERENFRMLYMILIDTI